MIRSIILSIAFVTIASNGFAQTALDEKTASALREFIEHCVTSDNPAELFNGSSTILSTLPQNGSTGILFRSEGGLIVILRDQAEPDNGIIGVLFSESDVATVMEVTRVAGHVADGQLKVIASGNVPTTGWSDATLIPVVYIVPPIDGIYDFTFIAKKPEGITLPVVSPIMTPEIDISIVRSMKGIRVQSGTNDYTLRILQERSGGLPAPVDQVNLESAMLADDDTLEINVKYSGGCARHDFELIWTGVYLESNPPVAQMRLVHDGNGDVCDGYLSQTLHFAMSMLDPCIIRIQDGFASHVDVRYHLPH